MGELTDVAGRPRIEPMGDSALIVLLGDRPDPIVTRRAHRLAAAIEAARQRVGAIGRPVPAHASVLVPYDPLRADGPSIEGIVAGLIADEARAPGDDAREDADPLEIPVAYGGADGPDLDEVAAARGLSPAEVVDLHASARFEVLFLGFAPGFAYLGGLPPALATPRRATPRERVAAGSVAIAGEQSAVYPRSMPGGWNVIGRTDAVLFDPGADPPTPLRPGRVVRFVPR